MQLDVKNFDEVVLKSDKPVLVDFWASWCGPCKMLMPVVEQLENELEGRAIIGKVNVDDNVALAERYAVMTIPTLLVFKNGNVVDKSVGAVPKTKIMAMLEKHM